MCVENKDLYTIRKIYSVVSMTLLYLTPILAVSVSHLLISRKLKHRMINRKSRNKCSRLSSKFLSKPGEVFESTKSERFTSPLGEICRSSFRGAQNVDTCECSFKDELATNAVRPATAGSNIREAIEPRNDQSTIGSLHVKEGNSSVAGQTGHEPVSAIIKTLLKTNLTAADQQMKPTAHECSGITTNFKKNKEQQKPRMPKLKPSLRREQTLQSHRHQLLQLGDRLNEQLQHRATNQLPALITETGIENPPGKSLETSSYRKSEVQGDTAARGSNLERLEVSSSGRDSKEHRTNDEPAKALMVSKGQKHLKKNSLRYSDGKSISLSGMEIQKHSRAEDEGPMERQKKSREEAKKRKKRTNRLLLTIALVFVISWLPMNLFNLLTDFQSNFIHSLNKTFDQSLAPVCLLMVLVSACVNPLLYGWLNENIRQEFQLILCCFRKVTNHKRLGSSVKGRVSRRRKD